LKVTPLSSISGTVPVSPNPSASGILVEANSDLASLVNDVHATSVNDLRIFQ